jgi:hypothetical protein
MAMVYDSGDHARVTRNQIDSISMKGTLEESTHELNVFVVGYFHGVHHFRPLNPTARAPACHQHGLSTRVWPPISQYVQVSAPATTTNTECPYTQTMLTSTCNTTG